MTKRTTFAFLASALCLLLLGSKTAPAQSNDSPDTFTFGPPLREGIVFSYRYTERVREIHEAGGEVLDSACRELTYFISQRQRQIDGGRWQIEVNVDSMRTEYVRGADTLRFDTQKLLGVKFDMSHREILGPSSIVNRVAMVTLTPYGEVLDIQSESFDFLREQIRESNVDAFTRERVLDILTPEYLTATLLPWRGVLPLGQTVKLGDTLTRRIGSTIDRIPFTADAKVVISREALRPTASFTADIGGLVRPTLTYSELLEPVTPREHTGFLAGGLMLDQDGVVVSGWTTAKGEVASDVNGTPMLTRIWHESVTETIGMMPVD